MPRNTYTQNHAQKKLAKLYKQNLRSNNELDLSFSTFQDGGCLQKWTEANFRTLRLVEDHNTQKNNDINNNSSIEQNNINIESIKKNRCKYIHNIIENDNSTEINYCNY